jgi:hypothetical protein
VVEIVNKGLNHLNGVYSGVTRHSIKMVLIEIGWNCMDWIDLAQDRDQWRALMNTVMNLRVP